MPTMVSYLHNNAFYLENYGQPGKGEVFNIIADIWDEHDAKEKECLRGLHRGDNAAPGITQAQRAIQLGQALDGTTMRCLGAYLHAGQA